MSQTVKAIALSLIFAIFAAPTVVSAAAQVTCTQAVQNANNLAATISSDAGNYWSHRQSFVDYKYGKSRKVVNALSLAATERSLAGKRRGTVPSNLAGFQDAIATARAQKCLSAAELETKTETTTTQARNVNFDQFPVEETEGVGPGSPAMPP